MSPSLRGSGLKSPPIKAWQGWGEVSLFTREWIEIMCGILYVILMEVSLFTREWIEIFCAMEQVGLQSCLPLYEGVDWNKNEVDMIREQVLWSPSLRGSGLKSSCSSCQKQRYGSLPLYEGVDWNIVSISSRRKNRLSPSLRGSGLKFICANWNKVEMSPSLRGSGLKFFAAYNNVIKSPVSLFTREWIEICLKSAGERVNPCLPLYEGVDWN